MEEWRDVVGYEGLYQVSNLGRVKSLARTVMRKNGAPLPVRERIMQPCLNASGYYVVYVGYKKTEIHRLVAPAFLGIRPRGFVTDHIDRNKLNNKIENLRYIDRSENKRNSNSYEGKISRYFGVSYHKQAKKWKVSFSSGAKYVHLGLFTDEVSAARAYDAHIIANNIPRRINNA